MNYKSVVSELEKLKNPSKAKILSRFFKTNKGEYGEGDIFLGIVVPLQRQVAKKFSGLSLTNLKELLISKIHEHRLTSLFILVDNYQKASNTEKEDIVQYYLKHAKYINNWDLVDLSAPKIIGEYLLDKDRKILFKFAKSKNLWQKRIAMLATYTFIKNGEFNDALKLAEILIGDSHDLIHKAVGWMLREIGKKDQKTEEKFLIKHYRKMPRTMLRYSIEKFSLEKRSFYLNKLNNQNQKKKD